MKEQGKGEKSERKEVEQYLSRKMSKLEPWSPLSYTTENPPRAERLLLSVAFRNHLALQSDLHSSHA